MIHVVKHGPASKPGRIEIGFMLGATLFLAAFANMMDEASAGITDTALSFLADFLSVLGWVAFVAAATYTLVLVGRCFKK